MRRPSLLLRLLLLLPLAVALPLARPAFPEDEPPSLARALYLERTAKDYDGALAEYGRLRQGAADPAARTEARLGEARVLVALGRIDPEALAAFSSVAEDPEAPVAARDEARTQLQRHRPRPPDPDATAEAERAYAARLEEQQKADRERRVRAADRLLESARAHLQARRYENARDDLIQALQLNPDDARATELLEDVGEHLSDRGDVLRQALRFVANSRLADFRRLSSDLDGLRERGRRTLREGKAADAARIFRDGVTRIDASDFTADLVERRAELAILLRRALDDAKAHGIALEEGLALPAEGRTPPGNPWRSEFYALLARVFSSRADEGAPLRFYEVTPAPVLDANPRAVRFSSKGLTSSQGPGSLRRARFVERHVRAEVAPGTWAAANRLLDRSDDTLIVQHLPEMHRRIAELLGAFPKGPPPPVSVDVAVLAAKPGGLAEAAEILRAKAGPTESGAAHVVSGARLEEQVSELQTSLRIALLGRATLLLDRQKSAVVRFTEPTSGVPAYREGESPRLVVPDRDATYGLDLELFAEDLPGLPGKAALSAVAVVRRPDRARELPLAGGPARVPVMLTQTVEADRIVPHAGSLLLLGLSNPFLGTGAAGDPAGGSHPDLVVLVSVRPVGDDGAGAPPDLPLERPAPPPRIVPGERTNREHDLGALAEVEDEAPPEDWPSSPVSRPPPREASRGVREAFLAGWLRDRAGLGPADGTVAVRDGRVSASLPGYAHARLQTEVERLRRDDEAVFEVSVHSAEAKGERVDALLQADGVREVPASGAASYRVFTLSAAATATLDERLPRTAEAASPFALRTRMAARHTQLVTARAVALRDIVEDFRVVRRADGTLRALPVNGTAEEGLVATLRPVGHDDGAITLHVSAALARLERVEPWRPSGGPGPAPLLDAPRHQVERAAASLRLGAGESMLLVAPSPGTGGARVVLVRASARRLPE